MGIFTTAVSRQQAQHRIETRFVVRFGEVEVGELCQHVQISSAQALAFDQAVHVRASAQVAAVQVDGLRVVRGLGHGLDEAALRAAGQIRFRPAQRNGAAYETIALVHIVFELAE